MSSSLLQNQTETVEKLTNRYLKYYIKPKWTIIGFIYFLKKLVIQKIYLLIIDGSKKKNNT